jgi:hypothetical protein
MKRTNSLVFIKKSNPVSRRSQGEGGAALPGGGKREGREELKILEGNFLETNESGIRRRQI